MVDAKRLVAGSLIILVLGAVPLLGCETQPRTIRCNSLVTSRDFLAGYWACSLAWQDCDHASSEFISCDENNSLEVMRCECYDPSAELRTFDAADICDLDDQAITALVNEHCGWTIILTSLPGS